MPSYEEVTERAGSLRAMTGLTETEFQALLPHFEQAFVAYIVTTNLFLPQVGMVMWIGSSYAEAPFLPRSGEPTMPLLRSLQHWLTGRGPCLQVAAFVPETPPLRPWAETLPWAALVAAVDRRFAQRVPNPTRRGRPPVSTRVLWAWELRTHALSCSDEQICSR